MLLLFVSLFGFGHTTHVSCFVTSLPFGCRPQVLDFMDTIFIVLKKSWRQLSFLHVYHHCTIFLVS